MSAFDPKRTCLVQGATLICEDCFRRRGEMRRREFIALVGGIAAWPHVVRAQQPAMALVGLLSSAQLDDRQIDAIRQGLKHVGYVEGRNLAIKYRSADSRFDRLPALAADLIADPASTIIALAPPAAVAAKAATTAIPIVFAIGSDPVDLGLVLITAILEATSQV